MIPITFITYIQIIKEVDLDLFISQRYISFKFQYCIVNIKNSFRKTMIGVYCLREESTSIKNLKKNIVAIC